MILVAGFATVFVALMYCTCICKEGRRVAPDGQPANVSLKHKISSIGSCSRPLLNLLNFIWFQGELYWTHHWQKNITIPELRSKDKDNWANQDKFPEDEISDTSSRDYPELYLESDYGQRTDRDADFATDQENGHTAGGTVRH